MEGFSEDLVGREARLFPQWSMALERSPTLPTTFGAFLAYYHLYVMEHRLRPQV